jgi:hypothetical protein
MKNKTKLKIPKKIWLFFHKRNVGDICFMLAIMQGYHQKLTGINVKLNQEQIDTFKLEIYKDFKSFKEYAIMRIKRKPYKANGSYNEWWNECNTNGEFAYNGVTDDF